MPSSRVTSDRALRLQDRLDDRVQDRLEDRVQDRLEDRVQDRLEDRVQDRLEDRPPELEDQSWVFPDRVLGILGHELRNPLSAIAALARVTMSRDDLPGDVRERLAQMDRAAQRSLAMITSLLDFSESRWRGALPARPVLAAPGEIAGRVIDELKAVHPDRLIVLEVRSPEPFELDPARMEQVLSNLIGNAIMHGSRETPVEVCIDVGETEALLAVKNRGPVIPPEQIASLFQPFTQGATNQQDNDRPRGLGLGLYIVQEIVDAHDGTISVDSHGDRGTTFLIRLPRRRP